jgi:hypothetical protein
MVLIIKEDIFVISIVLMETNAVIKQRNNIVLSNFKE